MPIGANLAAYFFDTSALVKLYVAEVGSELVASLVHATERPDIVISAVAEVEFASGWARKLRAGEMNIRDAEEIWRYFEEDLRARFRVRGVDAAVIASAARLAKIHQLRAYDALQLASCLESSASRTAHGNEPLVFVCSDRKLTQVAQAERVDCMLADGPQ